MIPKEKIERYMEKTHNVKVKSIEELGKGVHGAGYVIKYEDKGKEKRLILKGLEPRNFGHDHFSDRAQVLLLANYAYNKLPNHVKSVDVLSEGKELVSLKDASEFYILMEECEGETYFNDLERIFKDGLKKEDEVKAANLAEYLSEIHKNKFNDSVLYRRRIRDLVGHGECIMGIIDIYDKTDFLGVDLTDIAVKSAKWWGKIKDNPERLCVVHGDFHPGNIWFKGSKFMLLDRSRGEYGEAADDVSCLSMNYIYYAIKQKGKFEGDFKKLFEIFMNKYIEKTHDSKIFSLIAPFYAFRALVVANPLFYKDTDDVKRALLKFAGNVLDAEKFDINKINDMLK